MAARALDPEFACDVLSDLLRAILNHDPTSALVQKTQTLNRVNARNAEGRTPLAFAAACGNLAALNELVAAGADVRLQDDDGLTALHFAVQNGSVAVVERLVGLGAQVASTALSLDTPLHFAAESGRYDTRALFSPSWTGPSNGDQLPSLVSVSQMLCCDILWVWADASPAVAVAPLAGRCRS